MRYLCWVRGTAEVKQVTDGGYRSIADCERRDGRLDFPAFCSKIQQTVCEACATVRVESGLQEDLR